VGGGYVLAKDPGGIRLSEIIAAVDGPITVGDFGQPHQDGACNHEGQCVLLAIWDVAGRHMREHLDTYTLADIARAATGDGPWPEVGFHDHSH
jgi:Rrf2 family iron-sulfur cluster assembly transcriptional regulator